MFFGLQLDRGNLSNALTDNLLVDLNLTQDDYNNGTTVQVLAFLAAEFPVQLLIKRYGFKQVLPLLMMAWSLVSWTQAFMHEKVGFYITRALIGACEGGFIPGASKWAWLVAVVSSLCADEGVQSCSQPIFTLRRSFRSAWPRSGRL